MDKDTDHIKLEGKNSQDLSKTWPKTIQEIYFDHNGCPIMCDKLKISI